MSKNLNTKNKRKILLFVIPILIPLLIIILIYCCFLIGAHKRSVDAENRFNHLSSVIENNKSSIEVFLEFELNSSNSEENVYLLIQEYPVPEEYNSIRDILLAEGFYNAVIIPGFDEVRYDAKEFGYDFILIYHKQNISDFHQESYRKQISDHLNYIIYIIRVYSKGDVKYENT